MSGLHSEFPNSLLATDEGVYLTLGVVAKYIFHQQEKIMNWVAGVLLLAIVIFWIYVESESAKNKFTEKMNEINKILKSLPDFNSTKSIIGCGMSSGLAVDEARQKVCLITNNGVSVSQRVINYKDIFSVELFEDGTSVTKTVRSSQIGGAVVGGLLLGGVGALVGGVSGKTETSEKIKRIDLRLIVNDTNSPLHDVTFMNGELKKDNIIYTEKIQAARHWHGIVEVLIRRADLEEKSLQISERQNQPTLPNASVADEIKKLADLHCSGVLTLDEFQQQKTRLLGV